MANLPIRVVHLSYQLDSGGAESLQREFSRHADSRYSLAFVALTRSGRAGEWLEEQGREVIALNKPSGFSLRMIATLARVLKRLGAQVLHTHDNSPMIYGSIAARLAGVGTVVHTRHHGRLPPNQQQEVRMAARISPLVNAVCCVSEDSRREALLEGIGDKRLFTVYNGIDTSRFATAPADTVASGPAVSVSCLRPDKNTESLLRATQRIVREAPDFRLVIAGDGPLDRVAMLKRMCSELALDQYVTFLGWTEDVPALLRTAGMMILPSTREGVSVALLEAMSCGIPTIATAVGGNVEVIADNESGLLVPANDHEALAAAMLRLHRDPTRRIEMGTAGRTRVETVFGIRRMVRDYERLYDRFLGL
ncbi:glycosyltransferase [Gemmatimonas phototrophica]|uniref:Uncharacterized protein n=1 Tax=Gemmatimonas phototrophica TaxID=1379270 RepID=A0A143BHR0_9BACT|nr:glycosyltransferase [Gemmatimonas phototrophica]AMW04145.1 hypothetical protein GEMMAAP_03450 [Gemmatimonas phototrophica]